MQTKRIKRIFAIAILMTCTLTAAQAQKKTTAEKKLREVKIYLVKEDAEYDPNNLADLFPVRRRVDARAPLAATLKSLMRGETAQEQKRSLFAPTFGIQFVSVTIKDGTALARFTMPDGAAFSGTNSPLYFIAAVEKTALQFPGVKKVTVCLDGIIDFWREDESEPQSC
jgi:spore germination protein GerM